VESCFSDEKWPGGCFKLSPAPQETLCPVTWAEDVCVPQFSSLPEWRALPGARHQSKFKPFHRSSGSACFTAPGVVPKVYWGFRCSLTPTQEVLNVVFQTPIKVP